MAKSAGAFSSLLVDVAGPTVGGAIPRLLVLGCIGRQTEQDQGSKLKTVSV